MSSDAAEILDHASRILDERGWNQGASQGADGSLCVTAAAAEAGALLALSDAEEAPMVLLHTSAYLDAVRVLDQEARAMSCDTLMGATGYNDHVAETVEDVKLLIKAAQQRLRRGD